MYIDFRGFVEYVLVNCALVDATDATAKSKKETAIMLNETKRIVCRSCGERPCLFRPRTELEEIKARRYRRAVLVAIYEDTASMRGITSAIERLRKCVL